MANPQVVVLDIEIMESDKSVTDIYNELEADNEMVFNKNPKSGWTTVKKPGEHIIWSFSHPCQPTHPSLARRELIKKKNLILVKTEIICKTSQLSCRELSKQFTELNKKLNLPNEEP